MRGPRRAAWPPQTGRSVAGCGPACPGAEAAAQQRAEQEHKKIPGREGAGSRHVAKAGTDDWGHLTDDGRPLADVA